MQAGIEQAQPQSQMDHPDIANGAGRKSLAGFARRWGPYVLTALIVPGGIVVALLLLWRRWNLNRQAVQSPAGA